MAPFLEPGRAVGRLREVDMPDVWGAISGHRGNGLLLAVAADKLPAGTHRPGPSKRLRNSGAQDLINEAMGMAVQVGEGRVRL